MARGNCILAGEWNGNTAVRKWYCREVGGRLDGVFRSYHENGALKEFGRMRDGERDGAWLEFYDCGDIKSTSNYVNGKLHGSKVVYYPTAIPVGIEHWSCGAKTGYTNLLSCNSAGEQK